MYIVFVKVQHTCIHLYIHTWQHRHTWSSAETSNDSQMLNDSYLLTMERNQELWKVTFSTWTIIPSNLQPCSSWCFHFSPRCKAAELQDMLPVAAGTTCSCGTLHSAVGSYREITFTDCATPCSLHCLRNFCFCISGCLIWFCRQSSAWLAFYM